MVLKRTLPRFPRWAGLALVAGTLTLGWAVWLLSGRQPLAVAFLGLRISSRDAVRPLILGAILLGAGLATVRFSAPRHVLDRRISIAAALLSLTAIVLALTFGSFVAGGPDAYGYVSQAALWSDGSLVIPAPLASEATWQDAAWALTPLGYRPSPLQPGSMVPIYPPGLPLTMAALTLLLGDAGVYLVVPLLGGLALWLTYDLGRRIYGPAAGLIAAAAVFESPVFLLQLMLPMTDVAATAWWLLAITLALRQGGSSLIASGVVTAIAVLTRPNLVILALPVFALVLRREHDWAARARSSLQWGLPALTGPLAVAVIYNRLYGSPVVSGFGGVGGLFSFGYAWKNLAQYLDWSLSTQTPFMLLGIAGLVWLRRAAEKDARWLIDWSFAWIGCVVVSYLWYIPFDHWSYLRFLLPAFPMLLAASAATLLMVVRRLRWTDGVVIFVVLVVAVYGLWQGRVAFTLREGEARYRTAAEFARSLPSDAVIISNLHSGSLRYYANRLTLRYEWIGADAYEPALQFMRQRGRPVYAMLEDSEIEMFRRLFREAGDLSWLDHEPLAKPAPRVNLFVVDAQEGR